MFTHSSIRLLLLILTNSQPSQVVSCCIIFSPAFSYQKMSLQTVTETSVIGTQGGEDPLLSPGRAEVDLHFSQSCCLFLLKEPFLLHVSLPVLSSHASCLNNPVSRPAGTPSALPEKHKIRGVLHMPSYIGPSACRPRAPCSLAGGAGVRETLMTATNYHACVLRGCIVTACVGASGLSPGDN